MTCQKAFPNAKNIFFSHMSPKVKKMVANETLTELYTCSTHSVD